MSENQPKCAPQLPELTPEQREFPRKVRTRGCGHGECTTAETQCRYDDPTVPVARWGGTPLPRWDWRDLDRCEHGRHSIDHCFDCPGGNKGNPFLLDAIPSTDDHRPRHVRTLPDGRIEVRIGTMVRGEPIWVTAYDKPREQTDGE